MGNCLAPSSSTNNTRSRAIPTNKTRDIHPPTSQRATKTTTIHPSQGGVSSYTRTTTKDNIPTNTRDIRPSRHLSASTRDLATKTNISLPLSRETVFKLPSPLPSWPQGGGFAKGVIDLGGGLHVCQVSTFKKIWATQQGGPDNHGATFYEPAALPAGYFMLGCYAQPNNKPLFGWVLAGRDNGVGALKMPLDYKLVQSQASDGNPYIWTPIPPNGYKAVGHVVTSSPVKPGLDRIRCVRSDLTEDSQVDDCIWSNNGINIYGLKPSKIDTQAAGVRVGAFIALNDKDGGSYSPPLALACLKNVANNRSAMPNLSQIQALIQTYSPCIYFHPDDPYLPSSVDWYFKNGALLCKQGSKSTANAVPIAPTGSNLPQGEQDMYWFNLPMNQNEAERIKKGELSSARAYFHVKSMLGATFTDIAVWYFFPFNGGARLKLALGDVDLGNLGQHVGDWEHVTLRISNMTGELWRVFFSQHSGGTWVDASHLEFCRGNKFVAYASLHGHATYPKPGLVLQGGLGFGLRNDTAKSKYIMDTGVRYELVSAEHLGNGVVVEPAWLNFRGRWGPKIQYELDTELQQIAQKIPAFEKIIDILPNEILGEDGPSGPKMKRSWNGDE